MNKDKVRARIMDVFYANPGEELEDHDFYDLLWPMGRRADLTKRDFRAFVHEQLWSLVSNGEIKHNQTRCEGNHPGPDCIFVTFTLVIKPKQEP